MNIGALENGLRQIQSKLKIAGMAKDVYNPNARMPFSVMRNRSFDMAVFRNSNLVGSDLTGSRLIRTQMEGANLSGAKFKNTVIKNSDFRNSNLYGADFKGSHEYGSDFRWADLRNARLPDMRDSWITGAKVVNGRDRVIRLREFHELPSQRAKKEGHFDQWITRDRSGEGPAAITRPAVNP